MNREGGNVWVCNSGLIQVIQGSATSKIGQIFYRK